MFTNQPTASGAPTEEMRGGSIEKCKKISTDEGSVKRKEKEKDKEKEKEKEKDYHRSQLADHEPRRAVPA